MVVGTQAAAVGHAKGGRQVEQRWDDSMVEAGRTTATRGIDETGLVAKGGKLLEGGGVLLDGLRPELGSSSL